MAHDAADVADRSPDAAEDGRPARAGDRCDEDLTFLHGVQFCEGRAGIGGDQCETVAAGQSVAAGFVHGQCPTIGDVLGTEHHLPLRSGSAGLVNAHRQRAGAVERIAGQCGNIKCRARGHTDVRAG